MADSMTPTPECEDCSPELVVYRLDELKQGLGELREEVMRLREDVAGLKVRSGLWGAVAGAIPAGIAIVWFLFRG